MLWWVALLIALANYSSIPFFFHISLICRVLWAMVVNRVRRRSGLQVLQDGSSHTFVCLPHDLDFNLHANNSTYNRLGDTGRLSLFITSGLFGLCRARGWAAANGGVSMYFKREITFGTVFAMGTALHAIDRKWLYVKHTFSSRAGLHALGFCRLVFKIGRKTVPPAEVLEAFFTQTCGMSAADAQALVARYAAVPLPIVADAQFDELAS